MNAFVCALFATAALGIAGAARSDEPAPWMHSYSYRFEPPADAEGTVEARLDSVRGPRLLYRARVTFRADAPGPLTLMVPDPFALAGGRGTEEMRVLAFAGEKLVASF